MVINKSPHDLKGIHKLNIYTEVHAGEENQFKVWLFRLTNLLKASCPVDRVGIVAVVENGVDLNPNNLSTEISIDLVKAPEGVTGNRLFMTALNEMLSPQGEFAAYMSVNALPESVELFVQPALRNASRFITLPFTNRKVESVAEEMKEEFFRTKVFADNYYCTDVIFANVEGVSSHAANSRCYDFLKRYDLCEDAMLNKRSDLINQVIPHLDSYSPMDVFAINPFARHDLAVGENLSDIRREAHKHGGVIVYDRENGPWVADAPNFNIAAQLPMANYARAVFQAAEHLDADFIKTVMLNVAKYREYDHDYDVKDLPTGLRELVAADVSADAMKEYIVASNKK